MDYLILYISLLVFGGLTLLIRFCFPGKTKVVVEKVFTFALIAILIVRIMCYKTNMVSSDYIDFIHQVDKPLNNFLGISSTLLIWFDMTAVLLICMRSFFSFRSLKNITRFIALPILILTAIDLSPILTMLQGSNHALSVLDFVLPVELGLSLVIGIYYFIKDRKTPIHLRDVANIIVMFLLINLATMPPYVPQIIIGQVKPLIRILDITFEHRVFLYLFTLIIPFSLYFGLRNKHTDVIRFALIMISVATLTSFMTYYSYDRILEPWRWPFHLCNTAMFIMPICFIFKTKRLFYFTYFINVMGALIAMLMPNYAASTNMLASELLHFWINHAIAFFMPILGVALKEFKRPKIKQFYYSMAWFFGYFVLALVMNVVFSAMGHNVDYFFINSDYVADKLGRWAVDIYNLTATINIAGLKLVFHPIYQVLFFSVYVGIGFGIWFVYELFFNIADSHYELMLKLRKIKVDKLALQSALNGRSLDEPMNKDAGVKFELKHFSKKYATSKIYAVKDANLEVKGGEIFGFLGPNGAGKSTIIKSTVGIQPISEGSIEICGFDCARQSVQAKSLIGFVPDHYALYEKLSGREYLNYIADIYEVTKQERDERLERYIKLFQLESSIDNKIKTYSHGMKQKITIMAALIHNPKVWILDEPLTGLDPTSIFQVKECMKQHAAEGNIVFFSSHIIDIVEKLCQRIAIIKKGEIQCVKTVQEIEESGITLEDFYLETIGEVLEEK